MIPFKKPAVKEDINQQITLGFDEESRFKTVFSNLKRNFKRLGKQLRYSGIYNNFWLWNLVFLNFALAVILGSFIFTNYSKLPDEVGLTFDNIRRFDSVIDKKYLYSIVFFHILLAVFTLIFGVKAQRKLNHLIIAAFFNFAVLGFYEFYALRDLIYYFSRA